MLRRDLYNQCWVKGSGRHPSVLVGLVDHSDLRPLPFIGGQVDPFAEIMLEVEILEVLKRSNENIGLNITPSSISMALGGLDADGTISYTALKNASMSDMLFTIPDIIINLQKSSGNANILANPKIRVANHKKARIHIGDRIPIITVTTKNSIDKKSALNINRVLDYVCCGTK